MIKNLISTYHSIRKKLYNIFLNQNFIFVHFFKSKFKKIILTTICAEGSIKEWVCSVTRDKNGETRIWVSGLTFKLYFNWYKRRGCKVFRRWGHLTWWPDLWWPGPKIFRKVAEQLSEQLCKKRRRCAPPFFSYREKPQGGGCSNTPQLGAG